jgi:hypothetical protein
MRKIGSEAGTAFGNAIESLVGANPQFGETIKKLVKVKIIGAAKAESPAPYDETGLLPDNFFEDSGSGSHRSLSEIAKEIRQDWQKVNYAAKPYLDAMRTLDSIHDSYYQDDAESIVRYFLSNATSWRGEVAKRVKKELNMMLKSA